MDLPVTEITLFQDETGLGFNIRGGRNMPIGSDCGIYVVKINKTGAAAKDGQLQRGDKILEVNGIDLRNVKHEDAVSTFRNAEGKVAIKVQHGALDVLEKQIEKNKVGLRGHAESSPEPHYFFYIFLTLTAVTVVSLSFYYLRKR